MKEISFFDLLSLAWEKLWVLLLTAAAAGTVAWGICTFFLAPKYTATASVMVTNGAITDNTVYEKVQGTDLAASLDLTNTVVELLKAPNIFKQLDNKISYGDGYKALMRAASISRASDDTLFVKISFTTGSKDKSIKLANTFAELVPDYTSEFFKNSSVKIVATADTAPQVYPRTAIVTVGAALLGVIISYALVFIIHNMNHTVSSDEDISTEFGVPLLGTIPVFESAMTGKGGNRNGEQHR